MVSSSSGVCISLPLRRGRLLLAAVPPRRRRLGRQFLPLFRREGRHARSSAFRTALLAESRVVLADNLLLVHCLDARTVGRSYWAASGCRLPSARLSAG